MLTENSEDTWTLTTPHFQLARPSGGARTCHPWAKTPWAFGRHSTDPTTMWMAKPPLEGQWLVFNLGGPCDLEFIKIWDYNERRLNDAANSTPVRMIICLS